MREYRGGVEGLSIWTPASPATPAELHEELRDSNLFWAKNGDSEFLCQPGFNIRETRQGASQLRTSGVS